MYTVYVLYSARFNKIYIGYTTDLESRFISHNELGIKGWTIRFRPWEILHTENFESKSNAMKREKQLKSAAGREFIWQLVLNKYAGSYPPAGGRRFDPSLRNHRGSLTGAFFYAPT